MVALGARPAWRENRLVAAGIVLAIVVTKLDQTNARLAAALTRLSATQTSLAHMDGRRGSLSMQMQHVDTDLRSMRGDIHVMAHKIDGSFLFRGVK